MCVCDNLRKEIPQDKAFIETVVQEKTKAHWYKIFMIKWDYTIDERRIKDGFDLGYEDNDNSVEIPIQYCPFCGRKLSEE